MRLFGLITMLFVGTSLCGQERFEFVKSATHVVSNFYSQLDNIQSDLNPLYDDKLKTKESILNTLIYDRNDTKLFNNVGEQSYFKNRLDAIKYFNNYIQSYNKLYVINNLVKLDADTLFRKPNSEQWVCRLTYIVEVLSGISNENLTLLRIDTIDHYVIFDRNENIDLTDMARILSTDKSSYIMRVKELVFDSDHDGISDEMDDCPYDFGLKIFDGCPDQDSDDRCINIAGLEMYEGCPALDANQIISLSIKVTKNLKDEIQLNTIENSHDSKTGKILIDVHDRIIFNVLKTFNRWTKGESNDVIIESLLFLDGALIKIKEHSIHIESINKLPMEIKLNLDLNNEIDLYNYLKGWYFLN